MQGDLGGVLTLMVELEAVAQGKKELPLSELELAEFGPCISWRGPRSPSMVTSCAPLPTQRKQGHSVAGELGSRCTGGLPEDSVYFLALPEDG